MTVIVVVLALVLSALGGWPAVRGVLRLASRSSDAGAPSTGPHVPHVPHAPHRDGPGDDREGPEAARRIDGPESPQALAALRGGTWIGILERFAVTMCVLVDEPAGIAAVVAIKGLGRFPELKENPGASERFVIGTLASLVWAAGIGIGARALLA
ncbi:hypothetical protein [Cellulomonas sp. HZM]|uniref:hypothetical protein n=1 Tax=Cellulomonas sp. HZM TaxID=1454010 RepID=UPI0004933394|nr:hypothetical protein [Cellulomonas sp. HZM]